MATVVLQYAGAAFGTFLGGPIGGIIGRAIGAVAGSVVDQQLFGASTSHEGPRLSSLKVLSSQEGAPIPTMFGRMRLAGEVIWASNFIEVATTTTKSATGKGGAVPTATNYTYFANFAVGLCEGEIDRIGRVWADGKEIDIETYAPRLYHGTSTQNPDSLIMAIEGAASAPAYRGLAYIVFERLALAAFGNRLPQLSFEVIRKGNDAANAVKAVNIIPGSTEFGYDTKPVTRTASAGTTVTENAHVSASRTDFSVSIDQLQAGCGNLGAASLVVAWFGDDLRCGQCKLRPGVDNAAKASSPLSWNVAGVDRSSAHVVSQVNGQAAYGGTPCDASVVRAIQDLKTRGLKVMFYPFTLMDIAAGNNLPDPYGGVAQAAYPWRGRMTASVAAGQSGTVDLTSAAATEIASFVGTAAPAHFSISGTSVIYSGPVEWTLRRMILHNAMLCKAAGGVDAFLISSEMIGLSTLRDSAGHYPFVGALVALAADVKAILPNAKISYAADWSEYFGHHPQDGSGDVYFHLDPLWSSAAIDFIGVDNYLPMSDWRDGNLHLDYVAGQRTIYDRDYLKANIAGGENFDWYYASQQNRDVQLRNAIADGGYNKPWVYRAKDFKNWWSNQHYNRPLGIEQAIPTAWVPQAKPIWFTECGCPAIDKGTNQPNAFYDAKSSESAWPHYSGGQQDDFIQNTYVRAVQEFWEAGAAQNPVSTIYGAPMVDATRIFYWAWDARPFPAFPTRTDVWGDGPNYAKGHWLNGRLSAVDLGELITSIAARFGFADVDVAAVQGLIDGYALDRPMSARDALEKLLQIFAIDAIESDGKLKFRNRRLLDETSFALVDLVEEDAAKPIFHQTRAQETDLPYAVRLTYSESDLDYRNATVIRQKPATGSAREVSLNLAAAVGQGVAQAQVDVALEEAWAARETAQFILPPHCAAVEAGDVLLIGNGRWQVKSILSGAARKIEAISHDPAVYNPPPSSRRMVLANIPHIYGQPDVQMFDLAIATAADSPAPWIAAQATPWPGSLALYKKTGAASFAFNRTISQQATMGVTTSALPPGLDDRIDYSLSVDVTLHFGALASISKDEVLAGGNLAALGDASNGYEIFQFETAILIAPNRFRLSGLLRGQAGSKPESTLSHGSGQNFILLNAAVVQPTLSLGEAGLANTWRLGPPQLDIGQPAYAEFSFTSGLTALRPLSPSHLKLVGSAAGYQISWIRRTRTDGDSWDLIDVPLGETAELYKLDIYAGANLKRSVTVGTPAYLYNMADFASDFGASPAAITLRAAQMSAAFGAGAPLERIFNV